jgi:acetyl-CoA carboxylase carboxyltransferase component
MSWKPEVEGIEKRRELAKAHGGAEAVAKQHAMERLTIRERVDALLDEGSFREQGPIAGHSEVDEHGELKSFTPANYILGMGKIDGRPVVVGGEDFTQRGGSPSPAGLHKSVFAEEMACQYEVPLVRFLQGGGGSVAGTAGKSRSGGASSAPAFGPHRFASVARAMATAPVASAAVGAVAGLPAARLVSSHLSLMTRGSQVLVAGPAVVERAVGEQLDKEALGGAAVHQRSGVVDEVVDDEPAAFEAIRRFLSYLPTNIWQAAPRGAQDDPRERCEEELLEIIPRNRRRVYDMRKLLRHVVDRDSFFEMGSGYARSHITGLARLDGWPVGVWGNDSRFYAGAMTADASRKVRRFVDLCDTFHLPVIAFVDEPGFMIGQKAEQEATIRYGAEAMFAVVQSTVPWATVLVRKMYGVAGAAHLAPGAHVLAWPSAEAGALPIEGGVAVAFRRELESAEDPDARRAELEAAFERGRSPFPRAEGFAIHDLIDPRRTRPVLCDWLDWVGPRLAQHTGEHPHGIRP